MKIVNLLLLGTLLALTVGCGYSSKSYSNSTPAPGVTPTISSLNPDSATAGGAGFTLTVNGTNFGSKAVVNWNNTSQTTTYLGTGQLTVSVPASMIANSGTVKITVTNPATSGTGLYGTGGTLAETSPAMDFTIN